MEPRENVSPARKFVDNVMNLSNVITRTGSRLS